MVAGISLAGCALTSKTKFATVEEFCNGLPQQQFAIEGKTRFDQPWIDDTSEAVIAGCNRERPAPRPAHWDAAVPLPKPKPPAVKRQRTIRDRIGL